ncbi:MAG: DoxX family protein [Pseudomonadales bacterium]
MATLIESTTALYDRGVNTLRHFDGLASLLLRLILGPVLIASGWEKITGFNWFGASLDSFPFPFNLIPADVSWFLASWSEFLGGIALLLGLGVRLFALPLAVVMFVAAWSVHLDNGWAAIAPSNPSPICIPEDPARAEASLFQRFVHCYNVNERTIEASKRLDVAKDILRREGNWRYLNGSGSIVKLNSGIEFAASYFAMLLALAVIGGGRYLSLDYYLGRLARRRLPPERSPA